MTRVNLLLYATFNLYYTLISSLLPLRKIDNFCFHWSAFIWALTGRQHAQCNVSIQHGTAELGVFRATPERYDRNAAATVVGISWSVVTPKNPSPSSRQPVSQKTSFGSIGMPDKTLEITQGPCCCCCLWFGSNEDTVLSWKPWKRLKSRGQSTNCCRVI